MTHVSDVNKVVFLLELAGSSIWIEMHCVEGGLGTNVIQYDIQENMNSILVMPKIVCHQGKGSSINFAVLGADGLVDH